MKIKRKDFLAILDSVKPCAGTKELSMQLTSFVFCDGYVYTYNDEIMASNECPQIKGTFAVQANEFHALISKIKDDIFEAKIEDSKFVVTTKKATAEIVIEKDIRMPVEDVNYGDHVMLPPDFAKAVQLVLPATSKDMSKPLATCVHLFGNVVEAADVTCIARYTFEEDNEPFEECLIPAYSAKIIAKYDPTSIGYETGWVHFYVGTTLVISCRTQFSGQEYPNVDGYLDIEGEEINFPVALLDAIERCGIFTESVDGTETIDNDELVTISIGKNKCIVSGSGSFGKYKEETEMEHSSANPITFQTSPLFLKTAINSQHKFEVCDNFMRVYNDEFVFLAAIQKNTK